MKKKIGIILFGLGLFVVFCGPVILEAMQYKPDFSLSGFIAILFWVSPILFPFSAGLLLLGSSLISPSTRGGRWFVWGVSLGISITYAVFVYYIFSGMAV